MFYIFAHRRDDLTRYYWNRRKNEWQPDLASSCYYPTRRGVNRIQTMMVKDRDLMGRRFHVIGWSNRPPA